MQIGTRIGCLGALWGLGALGPGPPLDKTALSDSLHFLHLSISRDIHDFRRANCTLDASDTANYYYCESFAG